MLLNVFFFFFEETHHLSFCYCKTNIFDPDKRPNFYHITHIKTQDYSTKLQSLGKNSLKPPQDQYLFPRREEPNRFSDC